MSADGLFEAILDSPADRDLRHVYADWCDDHGDPERAEFIRLQLELAYPLEDLTLYAQGLDPWKRESRLPLWRRYLRRGTDRPPHPDELSREAELLWRNRRRWNAALYRRLAGTPVAGWVGSRRCGLRGWAYLGGFVGALACTPEAWLGHSAVLRRLGPIRWLRLCGDLDLQAWAKMDFRGLELVSVQGQFFSGPVFRSLMTAPCVRELDVLDLRSSTVWYNAETDRWLRSRPATERPQALYHLPHPSPPGNVYPNPPRPLWPAEPWLRVWLRE